MPIGGVDVGPGQEEFEARSEIGGVSIFSIEVNVVARAQIVKRSPSVVQFDYIG